MLTPIPTWHSLSSKSEMPRITEWMWHPEGHWNAPHFFVQIERLREETRHALHACCEWFQSCDWWGTPCLLSLPLAVPWLTGEPSHHSTSFSEPISKFLGPSIGCGVTVLIVFRSQSHFTHLKLTESLKELVFVQVIYTCGCLLYLKLKLRHIKTLWINY